MRHRMMGFVAAVALASITGVARGDISLAFTSDAPDLNNIFVGDTVTFNVVVSGVGTTGGLSFLDTSSDYHNTDFSVPTLPAAGAIVPAGSMFTSTSRLEFVDAKFAGGSTITQDGVFYSFSATALLPGQTQVNIFDYTARDATGSPVTITLSNPVGFIFTVHSVPEPASLTMLGLGAAGLVGYARRRRKAAIALSHQGCRPSL
jgi:hypothetical protein